MDTNADLDPFREKDIEVLLLTDELDQICVQKLGEYEGFRFCDVRVAELAALGLNTPGVDFAIPIPGLAQQTDAFGDPIRPELL